MHITTFNLHLGFFLFSNCQVTSVKYFKLQVYTQKVMPLFIISLDVHCSLPKIVATLCHARKTRSAIKSPVSAYAISASF